jgi:exodeoxyribonuclease VII small subunit
LKVRSQKSKRYKTKVIKMATDKQKDNLEKVSFEDSIKELTAIVSKIEQGEIPLQQSLEQYEKGMMLIKHCREILKKAEKRIEKIAEEKNEEEIENKESDTNEEEKN